MCWDVALGSGAPQIEPSRERVETEPVLYWTVLLDLSATISCDH